MLLESKADDIAKLTSGWVLSILLRGIYGVFSEEFEGTKVIVNYQSSLMSRMSGKTVIDEGKPVIILTISLSSKESKNEILWSLLRIIRHEFEHVNQLKKNVEIQPDYEEDELTASKILTYLTNKSEISAHIADVYFVAKQRGISWQESLKLRLAIYDRMMKSNDVPQQEAKRVLSTVYDLWTSVARRKYPRFVK